MGVRTRLQNNIHAVMGDFAQLSLPFGQSDSRDLFDLTLQECQEYGFSAGSGPL
jgi:hypothetical protein